MFLHLGSGVSVRAREVVGIFDYGLFADKSKAPGFYAEALSKRQVERASEEEPKALVITEKKIYLSAISPATLLRRARQGAQYIEQVTEAK